MPIKLFILHIDIYIFCVVKSKKKKKFLNRSFWPIDRTLTITTTRSQSEHGSNDNREVFHTPQISKTGAHNQIQISVIPRTYFWEAALSPRQGIQFCWVGNSRTGNDEQCKNQLLYRTVYIRNYLFVISFVAFYCFISLSLYPSTILFVSVSVSFYIYRERKR